MGKMNQVLKNFFYSILKQSSEKFDNDFLKKIADFLFILSEKIILNFDYFLNAYINYYKDMTNKEIDLVSISRSDKIVQVGCGSIPASSILISKRTKAIIVGIDKNKNSVTNAKFCIDKLKVSDKIKIKNVEASDFSFNCFDVILVAQGITPLYDFLNHLSKNISKNSKVILRTFSDRKGNLLKSEEFVKELFKVDKIIRHEKQGRVISVRLSVKD